jgi:hypothetical protein
MDWEQIAKAKQATIDSLRGEIHTLRYRNHRVISGRCYLCGWRITQAEDYQRPARPER